MNDLQQAQESDRLARIEIKIEDVFKSVEKTRKYFLWTLIITVLTIVLPIIAMVILIPYYLSTISLESLVL